MKRVLLVAALALVAVLGLPATGVAATTTVNSGPPGSIGTQAVHRCFAVFPNANCAFALANLNVRGRPNTSSAILDTIPNGGEVILFCWQRGQSINGDDVWYFGRFNSDMPFSPNGFMAGWYLSTGADPSPAISHC